MDTKVTTGYNPRYVLYAKEHEKSVEEMLRFDESRYPGGCMTGYILWISARKQDFFRDHPEHFIGDAISRHTAFTEHMREYVRRKLEAEGKEYSDRYTDATGTEYEIVIENLTPYGEGCWAKRVEVASRIDRPVAHIEVKVIVPEVPGES